MAARKDVVTHKVIFVGDSAVGKTAIINQYIYGSACSEHQPTVGIDFFAKMIKNGNQSVRMQIWDTAGQEKFHSLIPSYVRNSTVAVFVYDITSRASFDNLDKWHKMVTDLADPALIVVGNKSDLESERAVSADDGRKFAEEHKAQFIETSARTKANVNELFTLVGQTPGPKAKPETTEEAKPEPVNVAAPVQPATGGSCC